MNKAKEVSRIDGEKFLRTAFTKVQQVLEAQLTLSSTSITHDGMLGEVNEKHWLGVFRNYLPGRYAVDSGFIIDSRGHTSEQIDIVIYDLHYTPTLLTQEQLRYIPAEAVYAILEAKPHIDRGYLEYAANKAASVRRLYRTSVPIAHAGGTYPAKAPFDIVAGIVAAKADWADGLGENFRQNLESLVGDLQLNCGCALAHGSFDTFNPDGSLTVGDAEGALIFFLFRLLGKLQSLGTVPAIDWNAYAKVIRQPADSQ